MERTILHIDCDNFYASVECLYNPDLRGKPLAVAGDVENRHGIILAKNYLAKKYGVQTGDPLWMAKQKCRTIVFTPPHYDQYIRYSKIAREIYYEYTDQIESFGLDENWLDVTGRRIGSGKEIADKLRARVKFELGITASVGVSFNKIFAKLGSDMNKPDGTTVIPRENFQEIVWPLPVKDLLYVGSATQRKLKRYGIHTIGDLAKYDVEYLRYSLGKNGVMLWRFANGMDTSPVSNIGAKSLIKSVGNSTTTPRDLITDQDIKITLYALCESVAARLREHQFLCSTVQIGIRDNQLYSFQRQGKLERPSNMAKTIFEKAFALFQANHISRKPVRSLSVRACNLTLETERQLSFLEEKVQEEKQENLERAIDDIRRRFGHFSVQRGIMLADKELSKVNPKEDHVIHPEIFNR